MEPRLDAARDRLYAVIATATMAITCFVRLDTRGTWRDEHATWWATQLDERAFWRLLDNLDMVLAPYYGLMRAWVRVFGDSAFALRAPSALAMTCCALCVYLLGRRLFRPSVGLWASLLMSTVPSVVRYGQEARPYALAMMFTVLSLLILLRALDQPEHPLRWLGYGASVAMIGVAHLVALVSLGAHALLVSNPRARGRTLLRWLGAVSFGLLLVAPLIWIGRAQSAQIAWTLEVDAKLISYPELVFQARYVGLLVVALAIAAAWRPERARLALIAWALGSSLFLHATHELLHFYVHRYMVFTIPGWCLLSAVTLTDASDAVHRRFPARPIGVIVPAAALCLSFVLGANARQNQYNAEKVGTRTLGPAARVLEAEAKPDDGIVYAGEQHNWLRMGIRYELRGREIPRDVLMTRTPAEAGAFLATECASWQQCLPSELDRLWLLTNGSTDPLAALTGAQRRVLADRFELDHVIPLRKVSLALLVRKR